MFIRSKKRCGKTYLMIVKNERRVDGKIKQTVLHFLGRLDKLEASGELDGLLFSGQRFSKNLAILSAHKRGESKTLRTIRIGPGLIFEKLWHALSMDKILKECLKERKFEFRVERAVFLTVLHRLFSPGSDRAAEKWKEDYKIEGTGKLLLHQMYRAMAWMGEELPDDEQSGATPFSPRCVKDKIEEALFDGRRDLFSGMSVVFFDTTSIYFEGEGAKTMGEYGYSKDHRPDLKQMVVGVVLDEDGRPICCELWPGNTTDVGSLVPIADRLKKRFGVKDTCIVADRGMISAETVLKLEERNWGYILGVRMRLVKEVKKEVLSRGGRYEEVYPKSHNPKAPSPLKVKEVKTGNRRYIVCLNEDQARKDHGDREAIAMSLREALKRGDKSLVGNKGFRRYLKVRGKEHFKIDEEKLKNEERYDGKWVITTNRPFTAREAALKYKQLWMVEDMFRSMKSIMETRPIYHKCDETIRGHVFCSFLALALRKELQDRLEARGWRLEWNDIIRDLDKLVETEISISRKQYLIRSEIKGSVGKVLQACGVAVPANVQAM